MNRFFRSALALSFLTLIGCGRNNDGDRDSTASSASPTNEESLQDTSEEATLLLGKNGGKYRAAWDSVRGSQKWSEAVLKKLRLSRSNIETAKDIEDFCPGYHAASDTQKNTCWLRIISAMARFESNFNPKATYTEHTGTVSVGLLMMNAEHCSKANTSEKLKNPLANIDCALDRMELLIARDHFISGPTKTRGASAYWSVLRPGYKFRDLNLGKKKQIQIFSRSYLAYSVQ